MTGDVSGKGVPASLFMVRARTHLETIKDFADTAPQSDDITVKALRYTSTQGI